MKIALVGPTGCGKSTLVSLFMLALLRTRPGARFAWTACRSAAFPPAS